VPAATTSLEGVLERITFASEENGFSVVQLVVPGKRDLVTAVGAMLGAQPGESLRLTGWWVTDKKYGEQFKVESFLTVKPATLVGIEKYLGSGLVKGVGKVMASRLVAHFGLATLDVIDATPARLLEVEGIGRVRSQRITRAWAEQREIRQVMVFLQSHGVSTTYAVRIYKHYRHQAIAVVKQNPYRLALDIFGIGFKTADAIAAKLGISPTSPQRAEAGVLHVLGEASSEGHVWLPREALVKQAVEVLAIEANIIDQALVALREARHVVLEDGAAGQPGRVYSSALHAAETGLASALSALARGKVKSLNLDVAAALRWFEGMQKLTLAPEQQQAIRAAVSSKVLVITGGPGTGKTTLVNGIIQILEKKGLRIVLAAPTGRAARRMSETTGREAKTVHRLLEFSPKTNAFERNREAPLEADLIIIDEASMLDVVLAYDILKAIPPSAQLVLVGDVDQLPSVGPGRVLADLIDSAAVPVVRLQHIFRQAQDSLIITNAHRVNRGELPISPKPSNQAPKPDFYFLERAEPEEVLSTLKELVSARIPRAWGFHRVDQVQVLTPMHRGTLGAGNLNLELQTLLNPHGKALTRGSRTFREGDKVMQIRNNYDLDVFNGDIGRVLSVDPVEQQLVARFEEREVTYDTSELDELVLAYACSIHKSQGSEYPCVVMPLHTQHYVMLQRNLLYTGLTRGRRLVVIIGSRKALAMAVKATGATKRFTWLEQRLRSGP
jgi:exodeoxyribonuclease V alpha subunit